MKKKGTVPSILLAITLVLVACATSSYNVPVPITEAVPDYTQCVATYTDIVKANTVNMTFSGTYEFVVTFNEGCPLPDKSCTYITGGYDGGLSCLELDG